MTDTYLIYILKIENVDINTKKNQTTSVLCTTFRLDWGTLKGHGNQIISEKNNNSC